MGNCFGHSEAQVSAEWAMWLWPVPVVTSLQKSHKVSYTHRLDISASPGFLDMTAKRAFCNHWFLKVSLILGFGSSGWHLCHFWMFTPGSGSPVWFQEFSPSYFSNLCWLLWCCSCSESPNWVQLLKVLPKGGGGFHGGLSCASHSLPQALDERPNRVSALESACAAVLIAKALLMHQQLMHRGCLKSWPLFISLLVGSGGLRQGRGLLNGLKVLSWQNWIKRAGRTRNHWNNP